MKRVLITGANSYIGVSFENYIKGHYSSENEHRHGLKMNIKCFLGSLHVFGKDESVVEGETGAIENKKEKDN